MPAKNKEMKESEVQQNPDAHIDQDFEGFPHGNASKKAISPKTPVEKKLAGADKKRSKKVYGGGSH